MRESERVAALLELCEREDMEGVAAALARDPGLARARREDGDTALIHCAGSGWAEAARALMGHSDLSDRGAGGHTALMRAAEQGSAECARALIPGSDVDAVCDEGHTALGLAIVWGNWECAEALGPVSDPRVEWMASGERVDAEGAARKRGAALFAEKMAARKRALDEARALEGALERGRGAGRSARM